MERQLRRRFDRKVVWTPDCWWWIGAIGDDGYGRVAIGPGQVVRAHRWLWSQDVGPLHPSVPLRHLCDEANCVRLEHLLAGSHQLNMTDMRLRGRAGGPRAGAPTAAYRTCPAAAAPTAPAPAPEPTSAARPAEPAPSAPPSPTAGTPNAST